MNHSHPNDIFIEADGHEVEKPPLVVDGDWTITGIHIGSVCVHAGIFTIAQGATLNGSLSVQQVAHVAIYGVHNGSLSIDSVATSEIFGAQNGSVYVGTNAALRVASNGRLAGSLTVAGQIENAGIRGGTATQIGGKIIDLPGSTVKQPESRPGGANVFHW